MNTHPPPAPGGRGDQVVDLLLPAVVDLASGCGVQRGHACQRACCLFDHLGGLGDQSVERGAPEPVDRLLDPVARELAAASPGRKLVINVWGVGYRLCDSEVRR